jgi:hypothetical protein
MSRSKRLGVMAASTLISVSALLGFSAVPAMATPNFCNGNYLCVNEAAQTLSTLYIHMWAAKYSFVGHFELQTPEHTAFNSGDTRNYPNGSGPTFGVRVVYGWYCATAWGRTSPGHYNKLGYLCIVAGS